MLQNNKKSTLLHKVYFRHTKLKTPAWIVISNLFPGNYVKWGRIELLTT